MRVRTVNDLKRSGAVLELELELELSYSEMCLGEVFEIEYVTYSEMCFGEVFEVTQ